MRHSQGRSQNSWWRQAWHNKLIALVLVMAVIMPFVAVPAEQRIGGVAAFTLEAFAVLLAVMLSWRINWSFNQKQITKFLRTGPNMAVLLLLGLIVLSCIFVPNKFFGIQETLRWGAGILLFFAVGYQFRQSKHLYLLVDTLLFIGAVTALLSLGQYILEPTMRGATLFGNQQLLGSFLMILLPVAAVIALSGNVSSQQTSIRQLAAQFTTVLMTGCLLLAHTRSAWMGAAVSVIMLLALIAATSSKSKLTTWKKQKHKLVLPGVLILVTIGFVVLMGVQNRDIVTRADTFSSLAVDGSWQGRLQQWKGTLTMIGQRPIAGWGIGQYPLAQHNFTDAGVSLSSNGLGVRTSLAEQAHNFYLQTTAELGIPGLLLIVALLTTFMVTGVRRVVKMDAGIRRNLLMASLASVAAFSVDAIGSPSWQTGQVSIFFWLILGIGVACLRPRSHSRHSKQEPYITMPRVLRPITAVAAFLIVALLVMPTSGVASAATYNSHHGKTAKVATIAGVTLVVAGIIYKGWNNCNGLTGDSDNCPGDTTAPFLTTDTAH